MEKDRRLDRIIDIGCGNSLQRDGYSSRLKWNDRNYILYYQTDTTVLDFATKQVVLSNSFSIEICDLLRFAET